MENALRHLLAGCLERQGPKRRFHFRDDALDGAVVQRDDVFEDEHAQPDFLGQVGVLLLQRLHDGALGLPVHPVQHLDGHVDAADGRVLFPHE